MGTCAPPPFATQRPNGRCAARSTKYDFMARASPRLRGDEMSDGK